MNVSEDAFSFELTQLMDGEFFAGAEHEERLESVDAGCKRGARICGMRVNDFFVDGSRFAGYAICKDSPMKRNVLFLLLLLATVAPGLTGCTISDDPAPGGITSSETGMNATSIREWQDRTIRQLAY